MCNSPGVVQVLPREQTLQHVRPVRRGGGSDRSDDTPPSSTKVHFFRLLIPVGLFVVFGGSIVGLLISD